jgi:hypothetical protein
MGRQKGLDASVSEGRMSLADRMGDVMDVQVVF